VTRTGSRGETHRHGTSSVTTQRPGRLQTPSRTFTGPKNGNTATRSHSGRLTTGNEDYKRGSSTRRNGVPTATHREFQLIAYKGSGTRWLQPQRDPTTGRFVTRGPQQGISGATTPQTGTYTRAVTTQDRTMATAPQPTGRSFLALGYPRR